MTVHPSAIISDRAEVDPGAEIGPFCVVEGHAKIGAGTVVESNARIGNPHGRVEIGRDNLIQHGAVLGGPPQDIGYTDGETSLTIGDRNRIGEYVSINTGTEKGGGVTRVGSDNFIMAYSHFGHDCQVADHVIVTNGSQVAGHVVIEHHAMLAGLVGVTQFVRIGAYAFLTAGSFANKDIVPYTIAQGHWAAPKAVNKVGLKRAGIGASERRDIGKAVRLLMDNALTVEEVLSLIEEQCAASEAVAHFRDFVSSSERGVARW